MTSQVIAKPWTGPEGALRARLLLSVSITNEGWLWAETRTNACLNADLLVVVLGPGLEVKGLCLSIQLQILPKVGAIVPPNTQLFLVLGPMMTMGVFW